MACIWYNWYGSLAYTLIWKLVPRSKVLAKLKLKMSFLASWLSERYGKKTDIAEWKTGEHFYINGNGKTVKL